jgi:hypothetical protein
MEENIYPTRKKLAFIGNLGRSLTESGEKEGKRFVRT